jgi:nucleotide-binding universal stress UspA family protein
LRSFVADQVIHCGAELSALGSQLYRKLLIASEVTRQQQEMVAADSRRIDHRIVNLAKPHVRPIVRGKAGKKTEFGAKISISDGNAFVDVDRISWVNYNEANDLIARAEQYKEERGCYPAQICADLIYMTSDNKNSVKPIILGSVAAHARRRSDPRCRQQSNKSCSNQT